MHENSSGMMGHYNRRNSGWSSRRGSFPVAGACAPAPAMMVYSISKVTVTLAWVENEPGEK